MVREKTCKVVTDLIMSEKIFSFAYIHHPQLEACLPAGRGKREEIKAKKLVKKGKKEKFG